MVAFVDWLPAISVSAISSALLAGLGYLAKGAAERAIGHRYDVRIENLKSDLRLSEERIRSELKSRDDQIAALRNSALANLGASTSTLDKRRIEAAERIWAAVVDLLPYRNLAHLTQSLDFDVGLAMAAKMDSDGEKARKFADSVWKTANIDLAKSKPSPDYERLFVSPLAWARFSAYRSAVIYPAIQLQTMKGGMGASLLANPKQLLDAVKDVVPHYTKLIDTYGTGSFSFIIDDIAELILDELMDITSNGPTDDLHLKRAAKIMSSLKAYQEASAAQPDPPLAAMRKAKR